jgi:hypothetical protein
VAGIQIIIISNQATSYLGKNVHDKLSMHEIVILLITQLYGIAGR